MNDREEVTVTIGSGTSLSAAVGVGNMRIVGVKMPAGWDAAGITFVALTRRDDTTVPPTDTFSKVQDGAGAEVTITSPAADTYVALDDGKPLRSLGTIKVRSGTSGTPVNQTATRVLKLILAQ